MISLILRFFQKRGPSLLAGSERRETKKGRDGRDGQPAGAGRTHRTDGHTHTHRSRTRDETRREAHTLTHARTQPTRSLEVERGERG